MSEKTCVFIYDAVGEFFCQARTVHIKQPIPRNHLVPSRKNESWKISIVVKVMVGEKDIVNFRG
jgi:hypothetical protein